MQIGRHAKRRMRLYGLTTADVTAAITAPAHVDTDDKGRTRYWAEHPEHRYIRVVVAVDRPDLIVTVHPRRRLLKGI